MNTTTVTRSEWMEEHAAIDLSVSAAATAVVTARDEDSARAALASAAADMGVSVDDMARELFALNTMTRAARAANRGEARLASAARAAAARASGELETIGQDTEYGYSAVAVPQIEATGNYETARAKLAAMRASVAYRAGHAVLSALPVTADAVVVSTADGQVQVRRCETVPSVENVERRITQLHDAGAPILEALERAELASARADAFGVAAVKASAHKALVRASTRRSNWEQKMADTFRVLSLAKVAISGRAIGAIVATVGKSVATETDLSALAELPLDTRRDVMPLGMRHVMRPAPRQYVSDKTVHMAFANMDKAEHDARYAATRRHLAEMEATAAADALVSREVQQADYKTRRAAAARLRRALAKESALKG